MICIKALAPLGEIAVGYCSIPSTSPLLQVPVKAVRLRILVDQMIVLVLVRAFQGGLWRVLDEKVVLLVGRPDVLMWYTPSLSTYPYTAGKAVRGTSRPRSDNRTHATILLFS